MLKFGLKCLPTLAIWVPGRIEPHIAGRGTCHKVPAVGNPSERVGTKGKVPKGERWHQGSIPEPVRVILQEGMSDTRMAASHMGKVHDASERWGQQGALWRSEQF